MGNPALASDGYHLMENSAAIDKGITTDITLDIDGEPRPYGNAPDLGADEFFVPTPPTTVGLIGVPTGLINTSYTFIATVIPVSTTLPITYEWQTTDQTTIVNTTGITDQVTYMWTTPGDKFITLIATNVTGTVSSIYTVTITNIPPETVEVTGPLTGLPAITHTFTATIRPIITTLPITYIWQTDDQIPITHTNGISDTVSFIWMTPGIKTITLSADNGYGIVNTIYTIVIEPELVDHKIYLPLIIR
jgi:hypothetical protein